MKTRIITLIIALIMITSSATKAELYLDGFLQGLYGGRLDSNNPTNTEYTASETRLQLRTEHISDKGEFFGRMDFSYDGSLDPEYDVELREGYLKFRLGSKFDFKVGRQVLTWGTGDLIFINDVFAKDYRSFFVGRDDQYLKAPQNALRMEYYNPVGTFSVVWTPRFTPNRLPTGARLSYYMPPMPDGEGGMTEGGIVGTGINEMYYFDPSLPEATFGNSEIATRLQRQVGSFNAALYFYKGFYKNPRGLDQATMMPYYPRLNVYGASLRGAKFGGVLWLEGGYLDSRDDTDGDNPYAPNSTVTGMIGFERQVATNLTANLQWQVDYMLDYDKFELEQLMMNSVYYRDEVRHLLTSRVTKLLKAETVTLSGFVFYSPTDEDVYFRFSTEYKYTDEITLTFGGNIFDGNHPNTDYGQFALNDNLYAKMTYGF